MQKKKYEAKYIGRTIEAIIENIEITKKENRDNKIDAVLKEVIMACKILDIAIRSGGEYEDDKLDKDLLDYAQELITIVKIYKISERLLIQTNSNEENIKKFKRKIYEHIMDSVGNMWSILYN